MSERGVRKSIEELSDSVKEAGKLLKELAEKEYAEKWDRKYINDLPNAAFAVVEKGYSEGKNKSARHLPW